MDPKTHEKLEKLLDIEARLVALVETDGLEGDDIVGVVDAFFKILIRVITLNMQRSLDCLEESTADDRRVVFSIYELEVKRLGEKIANYVDNVEFILSNGIETLIAKYQKEKDENPHLADQIDEMMVSLKRYKEE